MPSPPLCQWRKIVPGLLPAVLIFAFAVSCRTAPQLSLTAEERAWLAAHGPGLEVLFGYQAPPDAFHNDQGQYVGYLVDFLAEIERHVGIRFTFRHFSTWSELLEFAKTGSQYIVVGIARTDDRAQYLLFTAPFIKIPYAIVTRQSSTITSLAQLTDHHVCTVSRYAINDYLARYYPEIGPTPVSSSLEGLHAVSTGQCDAMLIKEMYASYLIEKQGITNLKVAAESGYLNRLSAATSINEPILFSILEKAVDAVPPARRKAIYRKWVSSAPEALPRNVRIGLEVGLAIVVGVVLLLWFWTTSLRRQVEKQTRYIRERETRFRITLDSIGDGVITTDTDGRVTGMNPVAQALTGWTQEEATGRPLSEIYTLLDAQTRQNSQTAATNDSRRAHLSPELLLVSRKGREYRVEDNAAPIRDAEGTPTGVVRVFRDVTEKHKAEEDLLRIKKLESLGILAGGIAHDFNNLLTGLYGNISMTKMALPADHEALVYLNSAEKSMDAAVALTAQFLTFAKGGEPVRESLDLGKTLAEAADFASHGMSAQLKTSFPEDLWAVSADKGQLNQVVGNLMINAQQALPTGGAIRLTAKNVHLPEGKYVRVTLQDTGSGIAPEHLNSVFDPYFTTKPTGSGLGLATTYAIITKHGGTIEVDSEPGQGTTFTIHLPATSKPLGAHPSARLNEPALPPALEAHVLVLDDQAVIRKIIETILQKMGLKATFTVEGNETIRAYRKRLEEGRPFDAVILDLTIPGGMGGREASEKILAMDPGAKIIISSGYAGDPIMSHYKDHGIKAIAVKPYRFSDFREILLRVLLDES